MTMTIEQAQSQAAEICLTILTDAGLIGENLITKLPAARAAILEVLPKMYAACRQVEGETRKNMFLVSEVVSQMFGRAKWADHDKMMDAVEAGLKALVLEETQEETPALEVGQEVTLIDGRKGAVQGVDQNGVKVRMACDTYSITTDAKNMIATGPTKEAPKPVEVNAVAELVRVAKDSREGLVNRIQRYSSCLYALGLDKLNEYLIMSDMGCVAYEVVQGGLKPHTDLITAPGSMNASDLMEGLPEGYVIQKRIHAMQEVVTRSKEALKQVERFLEGVA